MKKNTKTQKRKAVVEVKKDCMFCREKKNPDFLEFEMLGRFTTERGKILGRARTGVCAKHQRRITQEVKRARHLALLPFMVRAD